MRRMPTALLAVLWLTSLTVIAQTRTFTKEEIEYIIELPSPAWHPVSRLDVHDHVDFIYRSDPANGYLRMVKKLVVAGATPADLFLQDERWELQNLPGYVACGPCSGERFDGHLKGAAFSYEYASNGRPTAGRIYYLQVDNRTFYGLQFTVTADQLNSVRSDMDSIARSFRLK